MREQLILEAISLLRSRGFAVSPFLHSNICFDIIAKKGAETLILKVFENIDAVHEEQAIELQKLSAIFNSTILILGNKSKAFELKGNVIYERYGISTISIKTLENFLNGKMPSVNYFKGKEIVGLDSEKLRDSRQKMNLPYSAVAKKIGTTIESIYRYEKGAKCSLETAKKLEDFYDCRVIKEIELFERKPVDERKIFENQTDSIALEKIKKLGAKIAVFQHAPFKALSSPEDKILIEEGKNKQEIKRKAQNLEKTKAIISSHSVIISKNPANGKKSLLQSAIIEEEELGTMTRFKDFIELVKEREKSKKGQFK